MSDSKNVIEFHPVTVDGQEYRIQKLRSKEGKRGLVRLMRILGTGLANMPSGKSLGDWTEGDKIQAVGRVLNVLQEQDVDYFCEAFAEVTWVVDGAKEPKLSAPGFFDLHFMGRYGSLIKWLAACLELNYGSFLEEILSMLPSKKTPAGVPEETEVGTPG